MEKTYRIDYIARWYRGADLSIVSEWEETRTIKAESERKARMYFTGWYPTWTILRIEEME